MSPAEDLPLSLQKRGALAGFPHWRNWSILVRAILFKWLAHKIFPYGRNLGITELYKQDIGKNLLGIAVRVVWASRGSGASRQLRAEIDDNEMMHWLAMIMLRKQVYWPLFEGQQGKKSQTWKILMQSFCLRTRSQSWDWKSSILVLRFHKCE